jgi:hypothetical protein
MGRQDTVVESQAVFLRQEQAVGVEEPSGLK